jgi:hypothetical protein
MSLDPAFPKPHRTWILWRTGGRGGLGGGEVADPRDRVSGALRVTSGEDDRPRPYVRSILAIFTLPGSLQ